MLDNDSALFPPEKEVGCFLFRGTQFGAFLVNTASMLATAPGPASEDEEDALLELEEDSALPQRQGIRKEEKEDTTDAGKGRASQSFFRAAGGGAYAYPDRCCLEFLDGPQRPSPSPADDRSAVISETTVTLPTARAAKLRKELLKVSSHTTRSLRVCPT